MPLSHRRGPQLPSLPRRCRALLVAVLGLVAAGGCTVGPNFHAPQTSTAPGWSGPTDNMSTAPARQADLVHWWTTFQDPVLTALVGEAMETNLDLKLAASRVRAARASRGVTASAQWPSLTVGGGFTRAGSGGGEGGRASTHSLFQVGLDASWEADIFGGIRRGVEAADADVQASVESQRNVLITVASEVALNYIDLRGVQQRLVHARENLGLQEHSADITRQRKLGGFVSGLDVANAEAQVATTRSQIPLLESSARQSIYTLSVLLGRDPAALVERLAPTGAIPPPPPEVPLAMPSELLRRRPDIRQAEAQIHSATARIGVATADLFPKVSLNASLGTSGNTLESLTDWASRNWSFGPSANWLILDGGGVRSGIELQNALQEQSIITYRQTVLIALQDVENALIAYSKEQENRKALVEAVAANKKAYDLSDKLYKEGQTDFLSVLIALRSLSDSEDALEQSTQIISTDLVALYKALGGGWDVPPDELPLAQGPAAPAAAPAPGATPPAGAVPPAPAAPAPGAAPAATPAPGSAPGAVAPPAGATPPPAAPAAKENGKTAPATPPQPVAPPAGATQPPPVIPAKDAALSRWIDQYGPSPTPPAKSAKDDGKTAPATPPQPSAPPQRGPTVPVITTPPENSTETYELEI
jgi:outer membrane protein, multidrug efflux system